MMKDYFSRLSGHMIVFIEKKRMHDCSKDISVHALSNLGFKFTVIGGVNYG